MNEIFLPGDQVTVSRLAGIPWIEERAVIVSVYPGLQGTNTRFYRIELLPHRSPPKIVTIGDSCVTRTSPLALLAEVAE